MSSGASISQQKILAASNGNSDLLEVLHQMAQVSTQVQDVTGTTSTAGTPSGQKNTAASVPAQATGSVSVLNKSYIVQLVNPGGTSPISQIQARQSAGTATALTSLQAVKSIYHQIRASTSPAFNVNSNTQTFGGDTGSSQTYWTLTGLGSGTWYIQFRSTFDGTNFNQWKNANSGNALGGLVSEVTAVSDSYSEWALFALPGSETMGIVEGIVPDQGIMGIPSGNNLYSSGLFAIAGPDGFVPNGNGVYGAVKCDVDLQTPTDGSPAATGILDYPVEIRMQYGSTPGGGYLSPGTAAVFGFCFNPAGENVTLYPESPSGGASWAVFRLPGGARIAIGQGQNRDGENIWLPPISWIDPSRMMSIVSLTGATPADGSVITGWGQAQIVGRTLQAKYLHDDGHLGAGQPANWLAVAWQQGTSVSIVGGFPFLEISLQGGHAIVIGAGSAPANSAVVLPTGYTDTKMLSIATPAGSENSGNNLRGVSQCSMLGLNPYLVYTDNNNQWTGPCNWMLTAWK